MHNLNYNKRKKKKLFSLTSNHAQNFELLYKKKEDTLLNEFSIHFINLNVEPSTRPMSPIIPLLASQLGYCSFFILQNSLIKQTMSAKPKVTKRKSNKKDKFKTKIVHVRFNFYILRRTPTKVNGQNVFLSSWKVTP